MILASHTNLICLCMIIHPNALDHISATNLPLQRFIHLEYLHPSLCRWCSRDILASLCISACLFPSACCFALCIKSMAVIEGCCHIPVVFYYIRALLRCILEMLAHIGSFGIVFRSLALLKALQGIVALRSISGMVEGLDLCAHNL